MKQLLWLRNNDRRFFEEGLDYVRLDDISIKLLFSPIFDYGYVITVGHQHKPKKICAFHRLGRKQQQLVIDADNINNKPVQIPTSLSCFGLRIQNLCQTTCNDKNKQAVIDGYGHLVRQAIRSRADILPFSIKEGE